MSRVGKKPIIVPEKTEVTLSDGSITVKGPLGELSRSFTREVKLSRVDNAIVVSQNADTLVARALWGTYASHVSNMVQGVNTPFEKKLALEGIGYKVEVKGTTLALALGFSHPVVVPIPNTIKVVVEKNIITISGIDKAAVGEFTAKIRALKKPEPYKGKGLRHVGEVIKIKQGKKSV